MGIPRLASTLQPYSVELQLQDEQVVIDGPALAYHILHICRVNGISHPLYSVIGQYTIAWLDELCSHRVAIKAIYFDGYLPDVKVEIRMERLKRSTAHIASMHSKSPLVCPWTLLPTQNTRAVDVFRRGASDDKSAADPSFLVPAVIEALRQSRQYRHLVMLVPGEADSYCASYVARSGGLVLTSDSDLLAYDLGQGRAVFLRDVYRRDDSVIVSRAFSPGVICEKLGIPHSDGPLRLAYQRKCDPHASVAQLVQASCKPVENVLEYSRFCHQYRLPEPDDDSSALIQGFDPRVSELVVQLRQSGDTPSHASVSLPVLIDSPAKGTAWEASTPVRRLAYMLLMTDTGQLCAQVSEHRRVSHAVHRGKLMEAVPTIEAHELAQSLLHLMDDIKKIVPANHSLYWHLVCLTTDVYGCHKRERDSLAWCLAQKMCKPGSDGGVSWDMVHAVAQLQAAFYSLRMLHQTLLMVRTHTTELMGPHSKQLCVALADFPSLTESPNIDSVENMFLLCRVEHSNPVLTRILHLSQHKSHGSCDEDKPARDGKRRRKINNTRHTKGKQSRTISGKPNRSEAANPFSPLSTD